MDKFKVGNRVVCTWPRKPHRGAHGIVENDLDQSHLHIRVDIPLPMGLTRYYIGAEWLIREVPLSRFDKMLDDYIQRELPNG